MVDFPDPEGPEITIGRCFWVAVRSKVQPQRTLLTGLATENILVPEGAIIEYWSEQQEAVRSGILLNSDAERVDAALRRSIEANGFTDHQSVRNQ